MALGYEFRVVGPVPEAVAEAFPELKAVVIGNQTVLCGEISTRRICSGLLARFRMLGLEMRPVPSAL
ncbi:hypothetical protein GCM10018980_18980 [Streptomyces capoamus]|uniref:Uncharacterized protein n=1 Tax=Streptomyces capoamus TaxID=68183 RepID=A0A919C1W6_9ACTN|nr:hypothetical protein GCM10018980_18980 [Streptomyces capoamus]